MLFNLHPGQPDVHTHRYSLTVHKHSQPDVCSTRTPVNLMSLHNGVHYTNTVSLHLLTVSPTATMFFPPPDVGVQAQRKPGFKLKAILSALGLKI